MHKNHRTLIFSLYLLVLILVSSVAYAITIEISADVPGCGDNNIGFGEQCDGSDLGGATCTSRGFSGGTLNCSSVCTFNTSSCNTPSVPSGSGGGGGGGSYATSQTSNTNIVFSGKAYPRSVVTLLKDAQVVATTIASSDATFQTTISGVSGGNYLFSVYAEDTSGNRSSLLTFPVSVTSGVTTKIGGIFVAPSLAVDKSEVKYGDTIQIFGQTSPESQVIISVNSDIEHFEKKKADQDGVYLFNFDTSVLEIGNHTVKAKVSLKDEISSYSKAASFIVGNRNIKALKTQKDSIIGDVNKDNRVSLVDLSIVVFWYKKNNPPLGIDMNGDNIINLVDLSILMFHWTG